MYVCVYLYIYIFTGSETTVDRRSSKRRDPLPSPQPEPTRIATYTLNSLQHTAALLFFRNRKNSLLKCCPGIIECCLNICRLKNSTPQTPKRAERARLRAQEQVQESDKPKFEKTCWKTPSICEINVIFVLPNK